MNLNDVDISKYRIVFCDHCKTHTIEHDCKYNLATCSGCAAPDCDLCEGGFVLEDNYNYIQLFQLLNYEPKETDT